MGKKPDKKPSGRDGPPRGYPKDQSLYADPENWRYPLHTSWHARAARRYFDDDANRSKYDDEECEYIDWKINEALKKFAKTGAIKTKKVSSERLDELTLMELLQSLMSSSRFQRIPQIDDSLVSISQAGPSQMKGKVKEYNVEIDFVNRRINHDCQDWRKIMESKTLCKHLGKFLKAVDEDTAKSVLRDILQHKDDWKFEAPE